jgi:hypothetical protein
MWNSRPSLSFYSCSLLNFQYLKIKIIKILKYTFDKVIKKINYFQGYHEDLQKLKFIKVNTVTWILFEYIQYLNFMNL